MEVQAIQLLNQKLSFKWISRLIRANFSHFLKGLHVKTWSQIKT